LVRTLLVGLLVGRLLVRSLLVGRLLIGLLLEGWRGGKLGWRWWSGREIGLSNGIQCYLPSLGGERIGKGWM
jgi:hypothetical protein